MHRPTVAEFTREFAEVIDQNEGRRPRWVARLTAGDRLVRDDRSIRYVDNQGRTIGAASVCAIRSSPAMVANQLAWNVCRCLHRRGLL